MTLLRMVFFGQLLVMLPVLGLFLATPAGLGTLYLLVMLVPAALATGIYALWQAWRYPPHRLLALATLTTPVVVLATPFVREALALEPVPGPVLAVCATVLAAGGLLALLAGRRRWDTGRIFRAPRFNYWLLATIACALLLIWLPAVGWLAVRGFTGDAGEPIDGNTLRTAALTYFAVVSVPALAVMVFGLLYAPVGLLRNPSARILHAGQLASALLLMVSLGLVALGLGLALINPG
ncbi:MAG: hypothetical protein KJ040_09825 [Gammaproteobacteria bacterium]|nr:hypothetical protein [Gammaproteobacteria bacterium]